MNHPKHSIGTTLFFICTATSVGLSATAYELMSIPLFWVATFVGCLALIVMMYTGDANE